MIERDAFSKRERLMRAAREQGRVRERLKVTG